MDAVGKSTATKAASAVACCLITAAAFAGAAGATPRIDSVQLDGAEAGKPVNLRVQATDPQAPVTGLVAGFGRDEGGFGISSCMPGLPAGQRRTLVAPHLFATPGTRRVAARVTSAGCTGGQPAVLQRLTVPVVRRGAPPQPITVTPPQTVPLGRIFPGLPGLGRLPLGRSDQPEPLPLPISVQVPMPLGTAAASCPGAYQRFRRTVAGESAARAALLCLLNTERRALGLAPMRENRRLVSAATGHSRSMVGRRFFAHVGPGSLGLADRLRRTRYLPRRGGRWLIGENIGFGRGRFTRPAVIHRSWMNSSPHRAVIVERRFREVGFGIVSGRPYGRGGATFTADYGRRGR